MDVRKDAGAITRAYSTLEIKAIDEDARTITGIASTPATDRSGDQVLPKGAQIKLPLPFLWQHDAGSPIGTVDRAKVTAAGIEIVATIAKNVSADIDKAWALIKAGLVRGLSIGFRSIDSEQIPNSWGLIFKEWELLEVSAVTVPANAEATIQTIKSFDTNAPRSAQSVVRLSSPGASGKSTDAPVRLSPKPLEGKHVNVQDEIKSFTNERAAKVAALDAILEGAKGATLEADKQAEYDDIEAEVDKVDKHLDTLRRAEARQAKAAAAVVIKDPGDGGEAAAASARRSRTSDIVIVERKLAKGCRFARLAGVMANAKGNLRDAIEFAKDRFPEDKGIQEILRMHIALDRETIAKAAVAVGTTSDSVWAGPLVQFNDMTQEFIEFLRDEEIVSRLGLRRVPFNVRIPRQTTGGAASWVGQGAPKPATSIAFDNVTLTWKKLATICVITQELARFSSPSAEALIRDALADAIVEQMDKDFIDPDNAGTANVKPASVTNGVTPIAASGTNEAALRADIAAVTAPWLTARMNPRDGVWIMSPGQAQKISLMMNALGQPSFPGIDINGGTLWGLPVVTSQAVTEIADSTGDGIIILLSKRDVLLADDGQATLDISTQASVQMSDTPDNPATASTVYRSLWQENLVGIRAERFVDWTKARAAAVQYIHGANYH